MIGIFSLRIAGSVLGGGAFLGLVLLAGLYRFPEGDGAFRRIQTQEIKRESLPFSLSSEHLKRPALDFPKIEEELIVSIPLPRPNGALKDAPFLIRCKKGAEVKQVSLPARIGLKYEEGLCFADSTSAFWVEFQRVGENVEATGFVQFADEVKEIQRGIIAAQQTPLQGASEFAEGSPFRVLGECKWWGRDLFLERYGSGTEYQRLQIGAALELLDLSRGQWLVWDGKWKVLDGPPEKTDLPIARIERVDEKQLTFEGWEKNVHVRIGIEPISMAPFKVRAEELFHTLRIRSEKQMSCTLEKQCLILSVGDWILKTEGRWKVLKKREEREAFQRGDLAGELFVLDEIDLKQKKIRGSLFDISRCQKGIVELPSSSLQRISSNQGKSR